MGEKSPFLGMDPYTEARHWWRGLHTQLIGKLSTDLLPPLLAPAYYVDTERSLQVFTERDVVPDIEVFRGGVAPGLHRLSRADDRPHTRVWSFGLDQPIPDVPLPLLAPDEHVPIPLQAAFDAVYQARNFRARLDYTREPEGHLSEVERAHIHALGTAPGLQ